LERGCTPSKERGLRCNRCEGKGIADDYDEDASGDCSRCCGTGWYREAGKLEFIVFRFRIADQVYCWHQPRELVKWPVELTDEAEAWQTEQEEKPLNMNQRKFADAKALVRFVIEKHNIERMN